MGVKPIQVITAIAVLIVGYIVAKIIVRAFRKGLKKTKLPELVVEFLGRFLSALLYVAVLLLAVRALGIEVGSVVLGLSAVIGLILGFGMQDTLTNLAAGVWIAQRAHNDPQQARLGECNHQLHQDAHEEG
ncbi:MAG: hypothetical protein PWQ95_1124 [Thermococcaceae archaeon]|nr:hypothetical protein [Thermococcaceae archaeon]